MPETPSDPTRPNAASDGPASQPGIVPPDATPPVAAPASPSASPTDFHIGDEFGTAKRNLPPAGMVLICIGVVAIIVGIFVFRERPKPQGAGSVNFVTAVEIPSRDPAHKNTLAAITFTLRTTPAKSLWIRTLKAQLIGADGKGYEDDAASAVDLDRYYQAFPPLKENSEPPLPPETRLLPGTERKATMVVAFPIDKEAFDQRKSLSVELQPYDQQLPIVLK